MHTPLIAHWGQAPIASKILGVSAIASLVGGILVGGITRSAHYSTFVSVLLPLLLFAGAGILKNRAELNRIAHEAALEDAAERGAEHPANPPL